MLHLFALKVMPDMAVIKDVQRTGLGQYTAQDLPLMGQATLQLDAQGNLAVTVQGALGPARYVLQRLEAQYPEALSAAAQPPDCWAGSASCRPPGPSTARLALLAAEGRCERPSSRRRRRAIDASLTMLDMS